MEPYQKILASLLLRDIIEFLPTKEKLALRLVNKDFEDAARHALKRGEVTFELTDLRLTNFLDTFNLPNRLLPRACVAVQPKSSGSQECLDRLGLNFGTEFRHLQIDLPIPLVNQLVVSRVKGLLNSCVNLKKLKLGTHFFRTPITPTGRAPPRSESAEPLTPEEVTQVNDLRNLKDAEFCIFQAQTDLICEILKASRVRTLSLQFLPGVAPDENGRVTSRDINPDFFKTVSVVPNVTLLDVVFTMPIPSEGHTLFKALVTSDVTPQQLVIRFQGEGLVGETDKVALRDWLTKVTSRSTLKKLIFSSNSSDGTEIYVPSRMTHIETLNVGTPLSFDRTYVSGHVTLDQRFSPAQIPKVKTIFQTTADETLIHSEVYAQVKTLIVGPKCFRPNDGLMREVIYSPNSTCWPTMFPNLTTLGIAVSENADILRPILTLMTYLVHLKVKFVYPYGAPNNGSLWDVFTGSHRPMLTHNSSPLEVISSCPPNPDQQNAVPQQGVCAIYNLRGLKTLEIANVPSSIYLAIVHFTSTKKVLRLDSLKLNMCHENPLPSNPYVECLKNYHSEVEISESWMEVCRLNL